MSFESKDRDYYCSMKFRYIKIDLESQTTYTCHAAKPHKVNFDWLHDNRGNIFNHDINVAERQMMLDNQRAPSCEQNCWHAEDQGMQSPRLYQGGQVRTHYNVTAEPEILDITVGSDCNLTCSYCCKEFSSAWRHDLYNNGDYALLENQDHRYVLGKQDRILMKIKQSELINTPRYSQLMNEIQLVAPSLKKIDVTGGEPFLNNHLIQTLSDLDLDKDTVINIYSGLGVDTKRFKRLLALLGNRDNIQISISAESIEKNLEFNRYGIKWQQFLNNVQAIRDVGIKLRFHCVLTNLTVFGFVDFYKYFSQDNITLTFAYQPRMMAINVLDDDSKQTLFKQFDQLPDDYKELLMHNMKPCPSDNLRQELSTFLLEFTKRRKDLDLSIYPETFLNWLGVANVV